MPPSKITTAAFYFVSGVTCLNAKLKPYLPLSLILIYVILAVFKINYPGFHYDELLFGNAALGDFDGTFVHKRIFKIPVMLMPYIGALKAYFYFPIFLVFDPSYLSVRLPAVFLTAVSLRLIYKFVLKAADFPTAVLSITFLAAEANFISLTRTDFGPVVIGLFFRSLALLYFFKFVENRGSKNLIIVGGSLLLGFYDKLNFVWFIVAFLVSAVFFYGGVFGDFPKYFKTRLAKILIGAFALIFIILTVLVFSLGITEEISFIPTREHLAIVFNNALGLTDGSLFYEYLIGEWNGYFILGWTIWFLIIGGSLLALRQPKSETKTFHFFSLLILFLIFVQILLTEKAENSWHISMLQPMTAILTASSLMFIGKTIFTRSETIRITFTAAAALAIFGFQFLTYTKYISLYEEPYRNSMWSKKIDELQAFTQAVPNRFVSMDWGFHTQLLTLGRQSGKYYELAFLFNEPLKPENIQWLKSDLMKPENECLFILHNENDTLFKAARRRFFETAEHLNLQTELVKTFDEAGRPLYEIYRLKQKS